MATKDCGSHIKHESARRRKILFAILAFLAIIIFSIFIIWTILQPSKPRFVLQDATVFSFNVTGNPPNLLTSNFQVTISSSNPNGKIGIYYDSLDVYASYQSQQITFPTSIPPTYQGHKEANVWSPFIGGDSIPVAPYNALALQQDHIRGGVALLVRIDGKVRWKVGSSTTRKSHIFVRCPAYINFGNSAAGVKVGNNAIKYTLITTCKVSVS